MKKSAAEAHRMLSNTYGEATISERTCREWFQRFKNGDFDVEDQHGIWWDQLGVVYYELLKPTETITGDRYRTQSLNHKSLTNCHLAPVLEQDDFGLGDEAHFWLNGYVIKQNCRIWSEANPQVYVETPLHPEKLTVWCALWAGGILLQKR
ncbi:uncharacterized protein TNCV_3663801 [Trichonephila clavipes]|nr:uncharacterized protein TNCV_3663801 [Trichonephila clavipes]